jgi:hypothetical protein
MLKRRATPIVVNSIFTAAIVTTAIFASSILVLIFSTLPAAAQARGGIVTAGAGLGSGATRSGAVHSGAMGPGHGHGHSSGRRSGSFPFLYPYDYGDYGYDNQEPAPAQVVALPAVKNPVPEPPAPPRESVLIEWQGDPGTPDYSEKSLPAKSTEKTSPDKSRMRSISASTHAAATQPSLELPPAVLVFRDGRHEEISSYTIMSGTIYSKADYWTNGSWTKKIQIADVDVPATLKLNHENGLNFQLPAGPNEVVVRP